MNIISKKSNAQRSAERLTTKTGRLHMIEVCEGGYRVVAVPAEIPAYDQTPAATPAEGYAADADAEAASETQHQQTAQDAPAMPSSTSAKRLTARAKAKQLDAAADAKPAEIAAPAAPAITLPTPPNFTAPTHKYYRAKLALLVAAAEAHDVAALNAVEIKPSSSSPKALIRYRDKVLAALATQQAEAA